MNLKNDIIENSVKEIEWNLMPLKEQKMYKYLVMNVQRSRCLTIGGLAPLNWPTCVQVSKNCILQMYFVILLILSYSFFFFSFSFRSSKTYMHSQHLPCQCILIEHIILLHSIYVPMM